MSVYDERATDARYAQCRGSNHWLEWLPHDRSANRAGIIPVWWRCIHCTTERRDELDATTLELVSRRYVYPDGYLVSNGARPSRATWRASYLRSIGAINDRQSARARKYRKEIWEADQ